MAERSSSVPQSLDVDFVADMVRDLQIAGRMGVLNVSDVVVPMYLLGQRTAFAIEVVTPSYEATDWYTEGVKTAGTPVMADTGNLAVGVYDFQMTLNSSAAKRFDVEWFDGSAVSKFLWQLRAATSALQFSVSLSFAANDQLTITPVSAISGNAYCTIGGRRRISA